MRARTHTHTPAYGANKQCIGARLAAAALWYVGRKYQGVSGRYTTLLLNQAAWTRPGCPCRDNKALLEQSAAQGDELAGMEASVEQVRVRGEEEAVSM